MKKVGGYLVSRYKLLNNPCCRFAPLVNLIPLTHSVFHLASGISHLEEVKRFTIKENGVLT